MIFEQINGKKNIAYIVLVTIAAISIYQIFIPIIYKFIPNDFSRSKIVLDVLKEDNVKNNPAIIILGNSIVMNSINAKNIANKLNIDTSEIYNLATTGQNFNESLLFYPLIKKKKSIKKIIQFVYIGNLINQDSIEDNRVDNLIMYGYEKNNDIKFLLGDKYPTEFDKSAFTINWKSRKIITSFINSEFRSLLRRDLNIKSKESLYFPSVYTKRVSENSYQKLINNFNPTVPIINYKEDTSIVNTIKRAKKYCAMNNIEFVLVFSPVNPALTSYTAALKEQVINRFNLQDLSNIKIINCMNTVEEKDFIDHVHPNPAVANNMAEIISTELKMY